METNSHPYTYSVHPTVSIVPACGSNGLLTCTFACDVGSLFGRPQRRLLIVGPPEEGKLAAHVLPQV